MAAKSTAKPLTRAQKKSLIGICHHLPAVIIVGQKGLTEAVMAELENALVTHELVKVKLRTDRDERQLWIEQILSETGSQLVQKIGQTASFYRLNPEKNQLEL